VFVHVTKETPDEGEERGVFIHLGGAMSVSFYLAGRNSKPMLGSYVSPPTTPFGGSMTRPTEYVVSSGPLSVSFNERITTEPNKSPGKITLPILQQSRAYGLLPCNNDLSPLVVSADASAGVGNPAAVAAAVQSGLAEIGSLIKPLFYKDAVNTLFVEPSVSERTVEEWQEWITPTPQPEPGWKNPKWFEELEILPEIPWKVPRPRPGDPWEIDVDSLVGVKRRNDWLVNPITALVFDGELIGSSGRTRVTMLPSSALMTAIVGGATPVSVTTGGGVGPATVAVTEVGVAGLPAVLTPNVGTLNVVGAAGFNAPLANNLTATNLNVAAIGGRIASGRFNR
jgi:hypothetical protein